jgi:hypothetical protein
MNRNKYQDYVEKPIHTIPEGLTTKELILEVGGYCDSVYTTNPLQLTLTQVRQLLYTAFPKGLTTKQLDSICGEQ